MNRKERQIRLQSMEALSNDSKFFQDAMDHEKMLTKILAETSKELIKMGATEQLEWLKNHTGYETHEEIQSVLHPSVKFALL